MREIIFDIAEVTNVAAIKAYEFLGLGDEKAADKAAVEAMRIALNKLSISGTIVIGEGERDEAPMLYMGEKVGSGGLAIDIAVDPLECTTILANCGDGALAVLACGPAGSILNAPDVYMDKIAIGFDFPERIIDLDSGIQANLKNILLAGKFEIEDLVVTILDRPRHEEMIARVREAGARLKLIKDGDVAAIIATSFNHKNIYMGIGGAPEGVLAASGLKTVGGQMCTRLVFRNDEEKKRAKNAGITEFNKQYFIENMVKADVIFVATGVTDGQLAAGVSYNKGKVFTETLVMFSGDKTIRKIRLERDA